MRRKECRRSVEPDPGRCVPRIPLTCRHRQTNTLNSTPLYNLSVDSRFVQLHSNPESFLICLILSAYKSMFHVTLPNKDRKRMAIYVYSLVSLSAEMFSGSIHISSLLHFSLSLSASLVEQLFRSFGAINL